MAAPEAGLSSLRTFSMLPGPARRDGRPVTGADDPMIANSIANRAVRERIAAAFKDLGYTEADGRVDFAVAFYASAREKLDAGGWDYGYPFPRAWPRHPRPFPTVVTYLEGTVIVDVVNPMTWDLLWRGEARAELSNDPAENVKRLAKAAAATIAEFPRATARVVAVRP